MLGTPTNQTTRRQSVFKGVFAEARMCKDDDDDDDEGDDEGNTIFEL